MKRKFFIFLAITLLVSGCGGSAEKKEGKKADSNVDTIILKNDLELSITDKKLLDTYGNYYATENGAILVLNIEVKNPTKKEVSFGSGLVKYHVNDEEEFCKTDILTGLEESIDFMTPIAAGDTLKGTFSFASPAKYSKSDKTYLEFYDLLDNPLGELDLTLTKLKKDMSDVTEKSDEAAAEGNMLVNEMSGYTVKIGNPSFMSGDEFNAKYPEYSLGLQNQYRYLTLDVEYINNGAASIDMTRNRYGFDMSDNFGDLFSTESYKMEYMGADAFDMTKAIEIGETRTGKILYVVSTGVTHIKITTNPVQGVNSEFSYEFDINPAQ